MARLILIVVLMIGGALATASETFAQAKEPNAAAPAPTNATTPARWKNSQRARESQELIQKALSSKTECEFTKVPLADAVEYFKSRHEIEIQLDAMALQEAKIDSDSPITCTLKDVSLNSALRLILSEINLAYVIQDEVLMITTKGEADKAAAKAAQNGPRSAAAASAGFGTEGLVAARIRHALEEKTECDFTETPLADVIDYFKDHHHIEIQIDTKALADEAIDTSVPVTRSLKNTTLQSALRLILGCLNLTYIIRDDTLVITSRTEADAYAPTRIYPVHDLLAKWPTGELRTAALRKTVIDTVQPTTWDDNGGPGAISSLPGALVISNSQQVHGQVSEVLTLMRIVKAAQIAEVGETSTPQVPGNDARPAAKLMSIQVHRMPSVDAECLRAAVIALIAPTTWKENGGEGSIQVVRALPREAPKPAQSQVGNPSSASPAGISTERYPGGQPMEDKANNAPTPKQAVPNQGAGSNESPPAIVPYVPLDGLANGAGTRANAAATYQLDVLVARQTDDVHAEIEEFIMEVSREIANLRRANTPASGASMRFD